jgi:hypothetical protein
VLAGALPLILTALHQARRHRGLRRLVSLPPLAVLVFAGLTGVLVAVAHSEPAHRSASGGIVFLAWGLAGLACGAVCVAGARAALFAVPVRRWRLVTAFACGAFVALAMTVIALATAVYAITLAVDASRLATSANGPFQLVSTGVSLAVQLAVMLVATIFASTTTRRGWRALARD